MSDDTKPSLAEERQKRRAAAEEKLAAKKAKTEDERAMRELALLEVRAKYSENGTEGEDFAVVDAGAEGPIVLKPHAAALVLYKEYRDKVMKDQVTLEAAQKYILPCVVEPEKAKILDILARRPALHDDLVVALHRLLGRNEALDRGK